MERKTVIIHGWSDSSKSFVGVKKFLQDQGVGDVESILYADYESREDNITFNDLADGLKDRFRELGIVDAEGRKRCELDVVVHSTGGLVIRHWIWRYYVQDGDRIDDCPVKRLVMLAPANFGSPLAHRGKSFLGSLLKGRRNLSDFLEVGRRILEGLELGSPYQWWLAENDQLLGEPYYTADRIQATVLVGIETYEGLRGLADKPGTDGTVVIAGTPLSSVRFQLDPCKPRDPRRPREPYSWTTRFPAGLETGFAVLPGLNHATIRSVFDQERPEQTEVGKLLLRALRTEGRQEFQDLVGDLRRVTETTYAASEEPRYQQFLVRAVDDHGVPVEDFTLEFFLCKASKSRDRFIRNVRFSQREVELSRELERLVGADFHRHSRSPDHRRFLLAPKDVRELVARAREDLGEEVVIALRVHVPDVDRGIHYNTERLEAVTLFSTDQDLGHGVPSFLFPNTTTLLEIKVDRTTEYVHLGTEPR